MVEISPRKSVTPCIKQPNDNNNDGKKPSQHKFQWKQLIDPELTEKQIKKQIQMRDELYRCVSVCRHAFALALAQSYT